MPAETSCTSCCYKLQLLFQTPRGFGYTVVLLHDHEARIRCNHDLQSEKTASSKMNGLTYPTLQFSAGLASLNDENSAQHSGCRKRCVQRDWPMLLRAYFEATALRRDSIALVRIIDGLIVTNSHFFNEKPDRLSPMNRSPFSRFGILFGMFCFLFLVKEGERVKAGEG